MFKKLMCSLIILFFLAGSAYASEYFRCGNTFIKIGDTKHKVSAQCGEPVSETIIGHTNKTYDMKIVELVYGPMGGVYYYLKFIGNRLVKIEWVRH